MRLLTEKIFSIHSDEMFNETALDVFHFQYERNSVYHQFVDLMHIVPADISHWQDIPCMPISFFKTHTVSCFPVNADTKFFSSSGTTSENTSKHYYQDSQIYTESLLKGFNYFFGSPEDYCFIALLPSYLEQKNASLVYMVNELMEQSKHPENGFHKHIDNELISKLERVDSSGQKIVLFGVTYALLDLIAEKTFHLNNTIIIETGGMKGRRKEMIREELHDILRKGFGVEHIGSEYGMTEMFSQGYSFKDGKFLTPPWLKIKIHDINCPIDTSTSSVSGGGISVIDLANLYSCSFFNTQDIGKQYPDGSFEVLGRFDNSDIRGCNLLYL